MKHSSLVALASLSAIVVTAGLQAQKAEKTESPITVEDVAIRVSPEKPMGPEGISLGTLCNLKVKLRNGGSQKASIFGFGVKINGQGMGL